MALKITVNISDADQLALENDLLDINQWVQDAVKGKINQCKKRFLREWTTKLIADPAVNTIPAIASAFVAEVVARPDYKNRVKREEAGTQAEHAKMMMADELKRREEGLAEEEKLDAEETNKGKGTQQ